MARSRMALAAAVLAALAAGATVAPAPLSAQTPQRYSRPLSVAEAGWVEVPLPADVVRKASGVGQGLTVYAPQGDEVPVVRVPEDWAGVGRPALLPARVLPGALAAAADAGPALELQVGGAGSRHDRLLLAFDEPLPSERGSGATGGAPPTPVSGLEVRLEGSDDGEEWLPLTVGELRPVDPSERVPEDATSPQGPDGFDVALVYPAVAFPRLRLLWPAGSTPPEVAAAAVELVPARWLNVALPRPVCRESDPAPAAPRAVCRLPLAGAGRYLRRLHLLIAAERRTGYRLLAAEEGAWQVLAEGVWPEVAGGEAPRTLLLELDRGRRAETLRLELYGTGEKAPAVGDANADFVAEAVLFRAAAGGPYRLAYGAGILPPPSESPESPQPPQPPVGVTPAIVSPGSETATEAPLPAALPTAAGPAPLVAFASSWGVRTDTSTAGELYGLELPEEVYGAARPELPDLRLLAADLQMPYLLWRPDEPALAAEDRAVTPSPGGGGPSQVVLRLPQPRLPLSLVVVNAAGGGSEAGSTQDRRARVLYPAGRRGNDQTTREASPWVEWTCAPRPPLPCRLSLPLAGEATGRLIVEIDDRGAPPLTELAVEVWRRRDVALFPWPSEERALVLAAGADDLEAPAFPELAERSREILSRAWQEARIVPPGLEPGATGRIGTWTVAITLTLATIGFVLLLSHNLKRRGA